MGVSSGIWIGAILVVGLFLGAILIGAGIVIGGEIGDNDKRHNNGTLSRPTNSNIDIANGNRDRVSNNRPHTSPEEIVLVLKFLLHTYRHNLSQHEKDCIEVAIKEYEEPKPMWKTEHGQLIVSEDSGETWTSCVDPMYSKLFCPMGFNPHQE